MESKKAFGYLPHLLTFPFKGEGAFGKLAIAAGLALLGMFIPIIPTIFLLGYLMAVMTKIIVDREEASMPPWEDWGKLFMDGLKLFGASLFVAIPLGVIMFVVFGFSFLPLAFVDSNLINEDAFAFYFLILFFIQMVAFFLSMIISVIAIVFQPVYTSHMVEKGEFSAIFMIKQWWKVFKKSFWEYVISFFIFTGLYMLVTYVYMFMIYSVVCCCLAPFGVAFLSAYMGIVYYALTASAYRDGLDKLDEDAPTPKKEKESFSLPEAAVILEETIIAEPVEEVVETVEVVEEQEVAETADVVEKQEAVEVIEVVEEKRPAPAPLPPVYDAATVKMDKLEKINGIGPKTASALKAAGILTFSQLADTDEETLKQVLHDAGLDVVIAACDDWPQQAKELIS